MNRMQPFHTHKSRTESLLTRSQTETQSSGADPPKFNTLNT